MGIKIYLDFWVLFNELSGILLLAFPRCGVHGKTHGSASQDELTDSVPAYEGLELSDFIYQKASATQETLPIWAYMPVSRARGTG